MALSLRKASVRDVAAIARVCVESLPDDPTFDYLWRYRRQYPEDNYFFWLQRLKANLFDPKMISLVITKPQHDGAEEMIVSFALWQRHGSTLPVSWLNWLQKWATDIENWAIAQRYQRRDGDKARIAKFQKVMGEVYNAYWHGAHPNNWHLELLFTHPDHRKQGAATKLLRWGLEQAGKEGADLGVESSPMGFSLYQSLGFSLIDQRAVKVDQDKAELEVLVMYRPSGHL